MEMEERYLDFEDFVADLVAYLVSNFEMEPRDALGTVMHNPEVKALFSSKEQILKQDLKIFAKKIMPAVD